MTGTPTPRTTIDRLQPVGFDPLRDIHKAIRAALFAVTAEAGRVDPSDDLSVAALEGGCATWPDSSPTTPPTRTSTSGCRSTSPTSPSRWSATTRRSMPA
jgi:hypothetical protein